jgi:hypothetical protein
VISRKTAMRDRTLQQGDILEVVLHALLQLNKTVVQTVDLFNV